MESRAQEILRTLSSRVRVLSTDQVSRGWWSETRWGLCRAKECLWGLASSQFLVMQSVLSRRIVKLPRPLTRWSCGDATPPFLQLAKILHKRAKAAPVTTTVVWATPKCIALFGTGRRPTLKITQMTHDLQVSEVFLGLTENGLPVEQWLGEDHLPTSWPASVRPDALLVDDDAKPIRAIEYGGDYSAKRLSALHDGFASIELDYELW